MAALRRFLAAPLPRGNSMIPSPRNPFSTLSSSSASASAAASSTPFSFRRAKSAIRSESDPDRIAEIFEASAAYSRFRRDRPVFQLAVEKLARSGRQDLIERLLERQKSSAAALTSNRSEGFFIRIMLLYSSSGMGDHAARTFDEMGSAVGLCRTEKSFCALLSVFLRNRRFDRVRECFDRVPAEIGVSPGVVPHNLLLRALCEEGTDESIKFARSLLDKMQKREKAPAPDIVSYNTLLNCYLRRGDDTGFDEILEEIKKIGIAPNLATYNCRIAMLCKNKDSFRAEELLDVMASKGIKPNHASFNAIIAGFCDEGDLDSAKRMFERMRQGDEALLPNAESYITLIRHSVEKGEFGSAVGICEECLSRKWVPPFEAMRGLVEGLVKLSKVEEARGIVENMKARLRGEAVGSWAKLEGTLPL